MRTSMRQGTGWSVGGFVLLTLSMTASNVACSSAPQEAGADAPSASAPSTFDASETTRRALEVDRWDLQDDTDGGSLTGRDVDGNVRAEVHVRPLEIDGVRWVEIESATDTRASFRFRETGPNEIEAVGAETLGDAAWEAAARAGADLEKAPTNVLTQALSALSVRPQTPRLVSPRPVSFTGDCLIFIGQVCTAAGCATGNDALSCAGSACSYAGQIENARCK